MAYPLHARSGLLGERRGQEGETGQADDAHGRQHRPSSQHSEQPHGLPGDEEQREVVGGQGERRRQRPTGQVGPPPRPRRTEEEQQRQRPEQGEQRVGASLLRVPDEQRADGHQRAGQQGRAPGRELPGHEVGHRHEGRAEQRRERPQADLPRPERPGPRPGQEVVERRGHLLARDGGQEAPEIEAHETDGRGLVEPEALDAEGGEAEAALRVR
ncbi:MAG: hypothetical protein WKF31_06150 [Thermoleophilaceae bacterium]